MNKLKDAIFPVFVYGPQGCGKTRNAEKIRGLFGADAIVDLESKKQFNLDVYAFSGRVVFLVNDKALLSECASNRTASIVQFEDLAASL